MMKKLKDILLEGYAWERKPGKSLPTLAEVQAEYQQNEAADATSEPRWQDSDGDGTWYEPGEDVKEGVEEMSDDADMDALNMPAIDEYGDDETHSVDADSPKNADSDVREEDDMNESFWKRVKGNLHGHEYILREAFRK